MRVEKKLCASTEVENLQKNLGFSFTTWLYNSDGSLFWKRKTSLCHNTNLCQEYQYHMPKIITVLTGIAYVYPISAHRGGCGLKGYHQITYQENYLYLLSKARQ